MFHLHSRPACFSDGPFHYGPKINTVVTAPVWSHQDSCYWKTIFLNLPIITSWFPSLSALLCMSLFYTCSCYASRITNTQTHTNAHTARGCIQTTMVERTRGDGLLTDRVQAVCVTLGGQPVISATALGNLLLFSVCVFASVRVCVYQELCSFAVD